MSRKVILKLLVCAILCAGAFRGAQAQTNSTTPNAAAPAFPGRAGGGRGFTRGPMLPPGPPAPVPPEVAIPRPTAEEVARMNADLKQFVEASPDKELLKKYDSLLTVQIPRDNPCIRPTGGTLSSRHQGFMNIATNEDFDILFLGDSITDLWNVEADPQGNPGGKRVFNKYFGDVKVANFGISGDTTQGVLWRLQNGEGKGAIVLELRKDFADAKIMLLAIFPRGAGPSDSNRRKCEEANKIIARLDDQKHVFFTDINSKFLNDKGGLIGFRTSDNLHPVEEGYEIWASTVAPTLKSWIQ